MNKTMCGIALIAAMGTAVLLTGCEKEFTADIKNSLPQEFTYYQYNSESEYEPGYTVNITEAVVSKVGVTGADIHITGEITSDELDLIDVLGSCLVGCKVYNSNDEETERYSEGISLDVDDNGIIDCTVNIPLGSIETDNYTIEFGDYYSQVNLYE